LGGVLQPLEGLLSTRFFGGMVESPDKLLEKAFIEKGGKGTLLSGVARQAKGKALV
jgi:hypothetical protein